MCYLIMGLVHEIEIDGDYDLHIRGGTSHYSSLGWSLYIMHHLQILFEEL